jgi:hypothetical protein
VTVLRCEAPHPARDRERRFAGRVHGIRLPAVVPGTLRLVRILKDMDHVTPGRIGVLCPHRDCRAVHEYEYERVDDPLAA